MLVIIRYFLSVLMMTITSGTPHRLPFDKTSHNHQSFITFEAFGAKGEGDDETVYIQKALEAARQQQLPVKLLAGKTYKFSPFKTIDITGIPSFTGTGTLDMSGAGSNAGNPSLTAIFQVKGTKKNLCSLRSLHQGDKSIQLPAGLHLKKGDILFLTSSEPLPNQLRPYYSKGQRLSVVSYDDSSGLLQMNDTLSYSYDQACLWLNDNQPVFSVDKGLHFITSPMNLITCFRIFYARAVISGYYKNFALTAVMYKSSEGQVTEMEADLPVTANNGYSHCIEIADMSDVLVSNCRLSGGRHVISGGGGGLWEKEECGGKGHAGYPSVMTIDGGIYKGSDSVPGIGNDIATLDAHGIVEKMIVKNCTVYGGINMGARVAEVTNIVMYPGTKRAFNIGNDVLPGSDWGKYTISDVTIHNKNNKTPVFVSKSDIAFLSLNKLDLDSLPEGALLMDFRNNSPKKIEISNTRIKKGNEGYLIVTNGSTVIKFNTTDLNEKNIRRLNY